MLEEDIIEPSDSEFINPLVIVLKNNGDVRVCLDARELNNYLQLDHEGAEAIDELLSRCANIIYMSTFDLNMSFWQIEPEKNSRKYTAFLYEGRCYQFKVVPFGTKVSGAALYRGIRITFKKLIEFLVSFIDDMLCISQNFNDHLRHLETLFQACDEYNLKILPKRKFVALR